MFCWPVHWKSCPSSIYAGSWNRFHRCWYVYNTAQRIDCSLSGETYDAAHFDFEWMLFMNRLHYTVLLGMRMEYALPPRTVWSGWVEVKTIFHTQTSRITLDVEKHLFIDALRSFWVRWANSLVWHQRIHIVKVYNVVNALVLGQDVRLLKRLLSSCWLPLERVWIAHGCWSWYRLCCNIPRQTLLHTQISSNHIYVEETWM